jgi:hypothetical protein
LKPLSRILLLLVTLVALASSVAVSPASAGKQMEVAIQDDGAFIVGDPSAREVALSRARALGVTHIRMNVLWWQPIPASQRSQTTTPSPITYNWGAWDSAIARASAWGIKTQLDLTGDPPAWACGSKKPPYACDGYRPSLPLFQHFVAAAAQHFKGRVSRYSIWNEPNWYTWLSPHDEAPILYRNLYRAGYDAIKSVDPAAEVVMGETAPHFQKNISTPPLQFIREMVCVNKKLKRIRGAEEKCTGGPLQLDAYSTHPYDFTHKPTKRRKNPDELTMANIGRLPKLLNKLRKKGLIEPKKKRFPIYLTEFGYFVGGSRGVPETKRAQWIVQAWQLAQENRRVKQMIHYTLVSPTASSPSAYFDMGLIAQNGTRRTSYFVLQNWIQQAVAAGKVASPGPCSAC